MTVEHGGWYPVTDAGSVLRRVRCAEARGVELVAIDAGPGMADLAVSVADGHSTSGTLGIGLGAIRRQATRVDVYSRPGRGTVLATSVWSAPPPASWAEGLVRPIAGETASGDGYAVRGGPGHLQAMLCDGLGHGPLAALAAQRATVEFGAAPPGGPRLVLEHLHRALHRTRGAVAAVVDLAGDAVRFAGLLDRQQVLVAATLLRDAGSRRDDAGVLVAKAPG